MPEIYADWKSLEPLTKPVPVGTKCVVIGNTNCHGFDAGQIVTRSNDCESKILADTYSDGNDYWWVMLNDIALLPADYQAEPKAEPKKVERKIVAMASVVIRGHYEIHAVCNDGTMWVNDLNYPSWTRSNIPPIPQD